MLCPVCKKNVSDNALRCPHCKTRIGLLCDDCNTVNPINTLRCKSCNKELLKLCPHCHSVNFPDAKKCRKCNFPFKIEPEQKEQKKDLTSQNIVSLEFIPKLYTYNQALNILTEQIQAKCAKLICITGEKGIGKTSLLTEAVNNLKENDYKWCTGTCSHMTQLTPGGVIQNMLLTLFHLPEYYSDSQNLKEAILETDFFQKEFKFLSDEELDNFINFLYNYVDGNYEQIKENKKITFALLDKVFDAFCKSKKFIFIVDNFDFIDGFSIEFLSNLIQKNIKNKYFKFIALYNNHRPIRSYFEPIDSTTSNFCDLHLAKPEKNDIEKIIKLTLDEDFVVTEREKEIIYKKAQNNPAFVEQAISYCFDCQISDTSFLMCDNFTALIKNRIELLKKDNLSAYKMLCGASVLGLKINIELLDSILGYKSSEFINVLSYLVKTNYFRPISKLYYGFKNVYVWETILSVIEKDKIFEEINIKIAKEISKFSLNTNTTLAIIAHNLKENRMAFDIWTKNTRLASYIGDINLYVISQKQCLALLNEFTESETLDIRYNISERLGKILTEYNVEEAMEFLPDAISRARTDNNEAKEIELLSYLAVCCKKMKNYYGDVECADNVIKKISPNSKLEIALVKATKLQSLLNIGNCEEVINTIDNDIMPVVEQYLVKPATNKTISLNYVSDTRLKLYLVLAQALTLQGNDRSFKVLTTLFNLINKNSVSDMELIFRAKLTQAQACSNKGEFKKSSEILDNIIENSDFKDVNPTELNEMGASLLNKCNLLRIFNKFLLHDYNNIQEELYKASIVANDTNDLSSKNMYRMLLGKYFYDSEQAKKAIEIYNSQITYFAKEKNATGTLLGWYLIAQAYIKAEKLKSSIDVATRALEIAQNPKINNTFIIILLKLVLAKAFILKSDFETSKIHLETSLILAKKYNLQYLQSVICYNYGLYYKELATNNTNEEFAKASKKMFGKALEICQNTTLDIYLKSKIEEINK